MTCPTCFQNASAESHYQLRNLDDEIKGLSTPCNLSNAETREIMRNLQSVFPNASNKVHLLYTYLLFADKIEDLTFSNNDAIHFIELVARQRGELGKENIPPFNSLQNFFYHAILNNQEGKALVAIYWGLPLNQQIEGKFPLNWAEERGCESLKCAILNCELLDAVNTENINKALQIRRREGMVDFPYRYKATTYPSLLWFFICGQMKEHALKMISLGAKLDIPFRRKLPIATALDNKMWELAEVIFKLMANVDIIVDEELDWCLLYKVISTRNEDLALKFLTRGPRLDYYPGETVNPKLSYIHFALFNRCFKLAKEIMDRSIQITISSNSTDDSEELLSEVREMIEAAEDVNLMDAWRQIKIVRQS